MNTELDLVTAITATPDCLTTRLVFADWLTEYGDEGSWQRALDNLPDDHQLRERYVCWEEERGENVTGYRLMLNIGFDIWHNPDDPVFKVWWWNWARTKHNFHDSEYDLRWGRHGELPYDWFKLLQVPRCVSYPRKSFDSRREAFKAANSAFNTLPPERQEELLRGAEVQ